MKPEWIEYNSYEEAKELLNCVYVFRKENKPLYIGKAKQFGGGKGRYAYGYGYLVDALLQSGCRLYILKLRKRDSKNIDNYERTLIKKYFKHLLNRKSYEPKREIRNLKLPWRVRELL